MARTITIAIVLTAIAAACGEDRITSSSGGVAGEPCIDYTSCGAGLHCFVSTDAVEGKCETLPAACADKGDCSCIGDALASRCTSSGRCTARVGRAVYSCPATVTKKEGETCSVARGCERGLYCRVDTVTRKGTCEKMSATCASSPSCECLKAEGCPGRDYRECSILGDDASVVCE